MPSRVHRERRDRRRALTMLAGSADGVTEALMLAHGFTIPLLVELIHAGLASATTDRVVAGGRTLNVVRLKITGVGRQELAGRAR